MIEEVSRVEAPRPTPRCPPRTGYPPRRFNWRFGSSSSTTGTRFPPPVKDQIPTLPSNLDGEKAVGPDTHMIKDQIPTVMRARPEVPGIKPASGVSCEGPDPRKRTRYPRVSAGEVGLDTHMGGTWYRRGGDCQRTRYPQRGAGLRDQIPTRAASLVCSATRQGPDSHGRFDGRRSTQPRSAVPRVIPARDRRTRGYSVLDAESRSQSLAPWMWRADMATCGATCRPGRKTRGYLVPESARRARLRGHSKGDDRGQCGYLVP